MIATNRKKIDYTVNSFYFRVLVFVCFLGLLAFHLHGFYVSVWREKSISVFWTITHISLATYLMLKNGAWDSQNSSGAITVYTLAITYVLHTDLLKIDTYTFSGANVMLMKILIISIFLAGIAGIAISFVKKQ